jgi:outer membrane protein TolC
LTDAFHDVADQVQSLRSAEVQIENQRAASGAAAATFRLAQQREHAGTASMLQVLAAESVWLAQRRLELDVRVRRADLRAALIKALGGGFDAASHELEANNPSIPPLAKSAP